MTIEKKGARYRIRKQLNGKRYSVYIDHKPGVKEAETIIDKHIRTLTGIPIDANGLTFGESCGAYIDLKKNVLSPSTVKGYEKIVRGLPEWFKDKKLDAVTAVDVQKVVNDITPNLSPKTVYNVHGFISSVLSVYRENLHLKTKLPLKGKFEAYTPTDKDVKTILEAVKGTQYEIPYRLAVYGMRRGEILALSKSDLSGNWVTINKALVEVPGGGYKIKPIPKTSESIRKVYIDDELADLIRKSDHIFNGEANRLNKHLTELQKELGINHFRLHDFRAYYVSMAHKIGIPDKFIMKNCGFSSSRVMDRVYKRAQDDALKEYNEQYSKVLGDIF